MGLLLFITTIVHAFSAYKAGKRKLTFNFKKRLLILSGLVFLFSFGTNYMFLRAALINNAASIAFAHGLGTTIGGTLLYALPTGLSFWVGRSIQNKKEPSP